MENPNENICFVMMPFDNLSDNYYKQIYKPSIESLGFKFKRADSLFRPSPIIRDIWEYINKSKILLADITGLNPNVMYELGLAHAISKPVIIISDTIDKVPFDLRFLRILIYDVKNVSWANDLAEKIKSSISEILDSPTDAILPVFLNIKPNINETDSISAELIEIKQLLLSQMESQNIVNKPKLNVDTLILASEEAKKLYFDEGWDILDIKSHLVDKFGFSPYTANEIFYRAINKAF